MKSLRTAAVALNQLPLDWDGNAERIANALDEARDRECHVVCLPELCISGYGCEDAFFAEPTRRLSRTLLMELVPRTKGMIVSFGLPLLHRSALYNSACLAVDGRIVGFAAKQALAGDGIHYEPRWFKPWPAGVHATIEFGSAQYPIGDLLFDCGGIRIGFEICEDAWVAQRPGIALSRDNVDVILNPSASHFAFGKYWQRRRLVLEASRSLGVSYVYANLLGNEAGRAIYDGTTLIATSGELVTEGRRFSYRDHELTTGVVDVEATRTARARIAADHAHQQDQMRTVSCSFDYAPPPYEVHAPHQDSWQRTDSEQEEEFTRITALGLFDYLRKSRAGGFVISLSGGADSAACACLVRIALEFAALDLGIEGVKRRLASPPEATDLDALSAALLTTAYQATNNSSDVTRLAARKVATAIASTHYELDVDDLATGYRQLIEAAIDRALTWDQDDLTLQNIQARTRAPSVWMLANINNALLLSTSNRSEAAVGYATMDGDTAGGLSPIAGIDKAFLRQWLRWLERTGPRDLRPIPELAAVNAQQPTAELRPASSKQTDEADLMPYPLLDAVEARAIRDKHSPAQVLRMMHVEFPTYQLDQLAAWVERFYRLFARNQWKRERYAPSFHVDDANLDPKTWCRFPILSGGFDRELREMHEELERMRAEDV